MRRKRSHRRKNNDFSSYRMNAMLKTFNHDVNFIDPSTKKVKFSNLKYDKQELFENTPIFPYPPVYYSDGKSTNWGKITRTVLSPFNNFQQIREHNKLDPSKILKKATNVPFYFSRKEIRKKK